MLHTWCNSTMLKLRDARKGIDLFYRKVKIGRCRQGYQSIFEVKIGKFHDN